MPEAENIESFRQAMRRVVASVCVVSVQSAGQRQAITVSSLIPVSMEPPAVLVSINRAAEIYPLLERADCFCVNILSARQESISTLCALPEAGERRFQQGEWHEERGMWWLAGARANLFCALDQRVSYATHDLVIGRITEIRLSEEETSTLLYWDGAYGSVER